MKIPASEVLYWGAGFGVFQTKYVRGSFINLARYTLLALQFLIPLWFTCAKHDCYIVRLVFLAGRARTTKSQDLGLTQIFGTTACRSPWISASQALGPTKLRSKGFFLIR